MNISDLLLLVSKFGAAAVIIAVLATVIIFLYKQQLQGLKDAKAESDARCVRLELEVKALNADLQRYIMTGLVVRQVMNEAAIEMSQK